MAVFPSLRYMARANTPFWHRCLRRNIRLYLAFDEPGYNELELEAGLQTIELELAWYLLGDEPPTVGNMERAQGIIETAQAELLSNRGEVRALLAEPLGLRYRVPLAETYILSQAAATGCWGPPAVRRLAQAFWATAA